MAKKSSPAPKPTSTVTVTLALLIEERTVKALQKLATSSAISMAQRFRMKQLLREIEPHIATYNATRFNLFEKFGTPVAGGENDTEQKWKFDREQAANFNTEHAELVKLEIILNFEPISCKTLTDDVDLNAQDLLALDAFIVE